MPQTETISKKMGTNLYHVDLNHVDESIVANAKAVADSGIDEQTTDLLLDLLQIRKGLLNIMRDDAAAAE